MSWLSQMLVPVHRDGHGPVLVAGLIFVVGLLLWWPIALLGAVGGMVTLFAFRDPDRMTPQREGLVMSAADGLVHAVDEAVPPAELDMGEVPLPRIAVVIGPLDCHVNRIPADGLVTLTSYRPGAFVNPTLDKASAENERQAIRLRLTAGGDIGILQIAGLITRRIVSTVSEGDRVAAGARFGLIRFGSRVDHYLPPGVSVLVAPGQRMVAGETVIADLHSAEGARPAMRR